MFIEIGHRKMECMIYLRKRMISVELLVILLVVCTSNLYSQITNFAPQTSQGSLKTSSVFHQEIARMTITVTRAGKQPLSLTQVPRVQKDDIIKVKLLDEAVNGIKPDQSQWDWTLLIAYINPSHRMVEGKDGKALKSDNNSDSDSGTISEEVQFRKQGWYKEYSFTVPYDSQPVFFLYPRPKYRKQLMKVVTSKYEDIRKLGDKTIEIAGAYAQIDSFLNELQMVLNRNAQLYGYGTNSLTNNPYGTTYNPYGTTYNPYGTTYNPYGLPTTTTTTNPLNPNAPLLGLQTVPALNQVVEGLARSFNIALPSCWNSNSSIYGGTTTQTNGEYGNYTGYNQSTYGTGYSTYQSYGGVGTTGLNTTADFVNRAQCVAKNVNLADFDISIMKMWQQGGVFLAAELQQKYPQLAYYINIAAVAIDFIVKVFQKSPLRIVPTLIQSNDPQGGFGSTTSGGNSGNLYGNPYGNSYTNTNSTGTGSDPNQVKISLFADSQPSEGQFITAYPIVVHKWQANPDPEVISLYPPVLTEPCLHAGTNILKSTDLGKQWTEDIYSRDFRLVISSENGFRKEFPLKKNIGLGGWELNMTPDDINQIPKISMAMEAELVGSRGFNDIKSPKFNLPISIGGSYELVQESQKAFTVGGRHIVTLRNTLGSCRCLQRVIYKPSFGGQFVYEVNATNPNAPNGLSYSLDGREVSFEVDTSGFQPGSGTLELKTYGADTAGQNASTPATSVPIKLYPAFPVISNIAARRGDHEILITGERLDQLQSILINGRRATFKNETAPGVISVANNVVRSAPTEIVNPTPIPVPSPVSPAPNPTPVANQSTGSDVWNSLFKQKGTASTTPTLTPLPTPAATPTPAVAAAQIQSVSPDKNINPNQRTAVFEDTTTRLNTESIALELNLEDNRTFSYPNQFRVGVARPTLRGNDRNEFDGMFLNQYSAFGNNSPGKDDGAAAAKANNSRPIAQKFQLDMANYPVVLSNQTAMTVAVENVLTDYNFKKENLSVETRIENAGLNVSELPRVTFDVLDTNNLRLNFAFTPEINSNLNGRRLQFRIIDLERGASDWYTIKQTFIRIPNIDSVTCTNEMNNQCELKGEALDYISQISIDGGRTWFPQGLNTAIQVQPTADGKTMMRIPVLINPKFLQIKLRDYPRTEGLAVSNFAFSNRITKTGAKPVTEKQSKTKGN